MKKSVVLLAVAGLLLGAGLSYARQLDMANSHVYVVVDPTIAVRALASSVNMGSVMTGLFGYDVVYRVDANTQTCKFMAGVSHLYKGNDPMSEVYPILIHEPSGVRMDGQAANPTGGHSPIAVYYGDPTTVDGFPGRLTEWVVFESSQNNHFSQDFTLTPTWNQDDSEKPMGEYSGNVQLWAMIVLP